MKRRRHYTHDRFSRWVTVHKHGPLYGRHILLAPDGTILAGRVPREMHGKRLDELGVLGSLVEVENLDTGHRMLVGVSDSLPRVGDVIGFDSRPLEAHLSDELEIMRAELDLGEVLPNVLVEAPDGFRRLAGGMVGVTWWRKGWSRAKVEQALRSSKSALSHQLRQIALERLEFGRFSPVDGDQPARVGPVVKVLEVERASS